jgi:hypothetical protein
VNYTNIEMDDQAADEDLLAGANSLVMQELQCSMEAAGIERVSAVFWAVPPLGVRRVPGQDTVQLPWRNSSTNRGLEEGTDCSIEVRVQYPPTNTHGFIWSTAKVHMVSTRDAGDPLHFDRMELRAVPTLYRKPWPDSLVRAVADGVVCVVMQAPSRRR